MSVSRRLLRGSGDGRGLFSQARGQGHTPSIAFRHLPPKHRFPAPSSKASLSGTFFQTARCGYATEGALYLRAAVYRRGQHPPKGSGTNTTNNNYDCRSNLAPKHARKQRCIHPGLKKRKKSPSRFKRFWFHLSWCKQHGQL